MGRFSWLRPDGQENVIEYAAVQRRVDDHPVGYSAFNHDITAQLRLSCPGTRECVIADTGRHNAAAVFAKDMNGVKSCRTALTSLRWG